MPLTADIIAAFLKIWSPVKTTPENAKQQTIPNKQFDDTYETDEKTDIPQSMYQPPTTFCLYVEVPHTPTFGVALNLYNLNCNKNQALQRLIELSEKMALNFPSLPYLNLSYSLVQQDGYHPVTLKELDNHNLIWGFDSNQRFFVSYLKDKINDPIVFTAFQKAEYKNQSDWQTIRGSQYDKNALIMGHISTDDLAEILNGETLKHTNVQKYNKQHSFMLRWT